MMGAKVENGCIVTWDELVKRMGFTKSEEDVKKLLPKSFDRTWKWLFQECQKIWNGKLNITFAEIADLLAGCVNGDLNGVQSHPKRSVIDHIKRPLLSRSAYSETISTSVLRRC